MKRIKYRNNNVKVANHTVTMEHLLAPRGRYYYSIYYIQKGPSEQIFLIQDVVLMAADQTSVMTAAIPGGLDGDHPVLTETPL